jgi:transposase InsO family protein
VRDAVAAWLRHYNTARPHQSLEWMTPAEWRATKLAAPTAPAAAAA